MSLIQPGVPALLKSLFKPCHLLDRTTVTVSGLFGPQERWVEGATLSAALLKSGSPEIQTAEAMGAQEQYTVVVERGVNLRHNDVLRRDGDGLTLRVKGATIDWEAPEMSTVPIARAAAERWDPPE